MGKKELYLNFSERLQFNRNEDRLECMDGCLPRHCIPKKSPVYEAHVEKRKRYVV
jgi:hypothetical protein